MKVLDFSFQFVFRNFDFRFYLVFRYFEFRFCFVKTGDPFIKIFYIQT
jgi:hypothetical protein